MAKVRWTRFAYFAVAAALLLPNTGCLVAAATAGLAGAGAAGYAYYKGAVPRDFPATMDQTWTATQQSLGDLGLPVLSAVRDADGGVIESKTGAGESVRINLEPRSSKIPADGQWTHVSVRVALVGDSAFSERLLNQIESKLPRPANPPAQGTAPPPGYIAPIPAAPPTLQTGPPPPY